MQLTYSKKSCCLCQLHEIRLIRNDLRIIETSKAFSDRDTNHQGFSKSSRFLKNNQMKVSQKSYTFLFLSLDNSFLLLHSNDNHRICLREFISLSPFIATWQDNLSCNHLVSNILAPYHLLFNQGLLALFYLAKQFVTWALTICLHIVPWSIKAFPY